MAFKTKAINKQFIELIILFMSWQQTLGSVDKLNSQGPSGPVTKKIMQLFYDEQMMDQYCKVSLYDTESHAQSLTL